MIQASKRRRLVLIAFLLAAVALAVPGCADGPEVRFVDGQRVYTLAQVGANAERLKDAKTAALPVEGAKDARVRALSRLRREGDAANEAADLLTDQFPPATASVPYYVEGASVDGKRCWIVMEAWGGRTGKLVYRRLWVFDRTTKAILDARMYR